RLVLDKQGKPYLQGWAVVENPTDEDWKDVRMALVSGRPISFQMDLYQPLYVPRPVVEPELFASLRPPTYSGGLGNEALARADRDGNNALKETEGEGRGLRRGESLEKSKAGGAAPPGKPSPARGYADDLKKSLDGRMDLGQSVSSAASASKLGDFFQYTID